MGVEGEEVEGEEVTDEEEEGEGEGVEGEDVRELENEPFEESTMLFCVLKNNSGSSFLF